MATLSALKILLGTLLAAVPCPVLLAQTPVIPGSTDRVPAPAQQLLQGPLPPPSSTSDKPSQVGISLPSLWWADRLYGEKLVTNWAAYQSPNPQQQQVQIFVRSNLWTRFSYLERYEFLNHFAAITRSYGYQMLVLDSRGYPLASYLCDFTQRSPKRIAGVHDANQQPILNYESSDSLNLPCDLWMNGAFPRNFF